MRLAAIAAHAPPHVWSNARVAARLRLERIRTFAAGDRDLTPKENKLSTTSDRWVRRFIGFTERRFCAEGQGTIDLATAVARLLLERSGAAPDSIDAVVFASVTPSHLYRFGLFGFGGGLSASFALGTIRHPLPAWSDVG